LLVERGLAETRSRAQALLLAGRVRVGTAGAERTDRKPGEQVAHDLAISLVERAPFVSRGGEKLCGALETLGIDPTGRACLDVGASTGGFTDCLLQRGARRVYALDVGRGQLAESLRADPRVVSLERTHVRRLLPDDPETVPLPEQVSLAVIDVSFISLTRVLGAVLSAVEPRGTIVAMVKPQFEAGPKDAPKGVVRDPAVRSAAVARVRHHARELGLTVEGEVESSLVGPSGNHEIFLHLGVPGGAA
jgi:23S rRNA (cytidine1920-2'-O)/16S rRNA (cytidine1409-2'-O)-methyltransferase